VLCHEDAAAHVAAALPAWRRGTARLHTLPHPRTLAAALTGADVRMLDRGAPLPDWLPATLAGELRAARQWSPIAVARAGGVPASFCYAVWESESLWDVSVDTLETWRGRGLAGAAVALLAAHMRRRGLEPVWGALETNAASLALARKLGFVQVDRLAVFTTDTPSPFFRPADRA
jgi:GNAT superfamily N-acetyltransferase